MKPSAIKAQFRQELSAYYDQRTIDQFLRMSMDILDGLDLKNLILDEPELHHQTYMSVIEQLKEGVPIQYILGEAGFLDLKLKVNDQVLIPRPETEELVLWVLEEQDQAERTVCDIGTGSGCIALALKKERPRWLVKAIDYSKAALNVAGENAKRLDLQLELIQMNALIEALPDCDIIVSNPPYIPENERRQMAAHVIEHEPEMALFVPDNDPLIFYRIFGNYIRETGIVGYFETHEDMRELLDVLLKEQALKGIWKQDIHGKYRMVRMERI